jgi:hypothetical protein
MTDTGQSSWRSWCVVFCIAGGTASLAAAIYLRSDANWKPVLLPVPGAGLEVASGFDLATAGAFTLQFAVPVQVAGVVSEPAQTAEIPCTLLLSIRDGKGLGIERTLRSLRHVGSYAFGRVELYESDVVELPARGSYSFRLRSNAEIPLFQANGAAVALIRHARGADWMIGGVLLRSFGFLLLLVGLAISLLNALAVRKGGPVGSRPDQVAG